MTRDPPEAQSHTGGEEVVKVSNIPEGPWLEKRQGRGKEGKGRLGIGLGKRPIESGIPSNVSDTTPGHSSVPGTQLRS